MRLRERDIAGIKAAADAAFDTTVEIRLFGSRVDEMKRGGDIDLHIVGDAAALVPARQGRFRILLQRHVGERAIDTIFMQRGGEAAPIDIVALRDGIIL